MLKLEYRQRTIGITPYRWGCYFHLRWKLHWLHLRFGLWTQNGVRVSTRRQIKAHRPRRYANCFRFHVSFWHTHGSQQGVPVTIGVMFYGGKNSGS